MYKQTKSYLHICPTRLTSFLFVSTETRRFSGCAILVRFPPHAAAAEATRVRLCRMHCVDRDRPTAPCSSPHPNGRDRQELHNGCLRAGDDRARPARETVSEEGEKKVPSGI